LACLAHGQNHLGRGGFVQAVVHKDEQVIGPEQNGTLVRKVKNLPGASKEKASPAGAKKIAVVVRGKVRKTGKLYCPWVAAS
jgi:hypothetical protein